MTILAKDLKRELIILTLTRIRISSPRCPTTYRRLWIFNIESKKTAKES